jgi:hypothetical protein
MTNPKKRFILALLQYGGGFDCGHSIDARLTLASPKLAYAETPPTFEQSSG